MTSYVKNTFNFLGNVAPYASLARAALNLRKKNYTIAATQSVLSLGLFKLFGNAIEWLHIKNTFNFLGNVASYAFLATSASNLREKNYTVAATQGVLSLGLFKLSGDAVSWLTGFASNAISNTVNGNYTEALKQGVFHLCLSNLHESKDALIHSNVIHGAFGSVFSSVLVELWRAVLSDEEDESATQQIKKAFQNRGLQTINALWIWQLASMLGPHKTATLAQSIALGSISSLGVKSGVQDIRNGSYLKGLGKIALGVEGIALSLFGFHSVT